ncbi:MAG TPA: oligopeptide/dipeptide ABC transporter ATP-binding protein [Stellaceae bacterium]|nr:oligopeptide/dipeptide ABC transporter ATP-binding protein [Stellaceae bacterium]
MTPPLLRVSDLAVHFPLRRSRPFAAPRAVRAVDGIGFEITAGRTFGLVGESGSGKTTTALAVMRLVEPTRGRIELGGTDLARLSGAALRPLRRRFQMIFQDPFSSLNPRATAGAIVREPLDLMAVGTPHGRADRVAELFEAVGLRPEQQQLFPHQFSGGQRQRIGIARALATRPDLVVCDEPVSALDVAIRAQILNLLVRLQRDYRLAYLFISHDLGVVQYMCDDIAVMYLGRIVELTDRASLFRQPLHPYTWALLSAVPGAVGKDASARQRIRLAGDPPSAIEPAAGCGFASRCPFAQPRCRSERPELRAVAAGGRVACHLVDDSGRGPHQTPPRPALELSDTRNR